MPVLCVETSPPSPPPPACLPPPSSSVMQKGRRRTEEHGDSQISWGSRLRGVGLNKAFSEVVLAQGEAGSPAWTCAVCFPRGLKEPEEATQAPRSIGSPATRACVRKGRWACPLLGLRVYQPKTFVFPPPSPRPLPPPLLPPPRSQVLCISVLITRLQRREFSPSAQQGDCQMTGRDRTFICLELI